MNRLNASPVFTPRTQTSVKFGNSNDNNTPPTGSGPEAPKATQIIGQGQTLPPTPTTIEQGILDIIRKEDSTANLKRDIWMIKDTTTGQKYSVFLDGSEAELVALYKELEKWGVGAKVKASGVAAKPVPMQRFPFLMVESLEKRP